MREAFLNAEGHWEQLLLWVQDTVERKDIVHLWGILPPTALSKQFEAYIALARRVQLCRGSVSFALPRCAEGFKPPNVEDAVGQMQLTPLDVDDVSGQLRIHTNNHRLIVELQGLRCVPGGSVHDAVQGAVVRADGCSRRMAISIINALFPEESMRFVPAMPCLAQGDQVHEHRVRNDASFLPLPVLAGVHKLLSREEAKSIPQAVQAIKDEGEGVRKMNVWDDSTVVEKDELLAQARMQQQEIHVADIMPIASIKNYETPEQRKYKGRLVYRGDNTRDAFGAKALFQNLSSMPTTFQTLNILLWFGSLVGHVVRICDARKAYLQADLVSPVLTWVTLPPELWLPHWRGFRRPTVLLRKALYGHPEASAHWERHLARILVEVVGLVPVQGHASCFWWAEWSLVVAVYVDDILASGPPASQDKFWEVLVTHVDLEEVMELDKFLGRAHTLLEKPRRILLDMADYSKQTVEYYLEVTSLGKLQTVDTPHLGSTTLKDSDFDNRGVLGDLASSVLMRLLWVARL